MVQTLEQFLGENIIAKIHTGIRAHPIHPDTPHLKKDVLQAAEHACHRAWSDIVDTNAVASRRSEAAKDALLTKCRTLYRMSIESGAHPTAEYQECVVSLMITDFSVLESTRSQLVKNRLWDLSRYFYSIRYTQCDDEHLFLIPPEFRHLYTN